MWGTSSFPPWNSTALSSFNQKQLHPMSIPSFWGGKNVTQPPHLRAASPEYLSREMQQHCSELRQKTQTPPRPPHCSSGLSNAQEGLGGEDLHSFHIR